MQNKVRSPFFYVGDKYKLMPQLIDLFPKNIETYYEPFVGGGSSFLNVKAAKYIVNDFNEYVIKLHKHISSYAGRIDSLLEELKEIINEYNLSCSFLGMYVPSELKEKYVKTYYSKYNKEQYIKLRESYNHDKSLSKLYLLLVYGFNHMIRFNSKGEFNLPVGNVDFNNNVYNALVNYLEFVSSEDIQFIASDYLEFVRSIKFEKGDFIYFDPPYLISNSEYNKYWTVDDEKRLYELIDTLHQKGINFGLSNMTKHKDLENIILKKWMEKYNVYEIKSNYISRFDNSIKSKLKEVYVTNYEGK